MSFELAAGAIGFSCGYKDTIMALDNGFGPLLTAYASAERYFELLKESKIRGYLFEQQNYVPK